MVTALRLSTDGARARRVRGVAVWVTVAAVCTAGLWTLRDVLDEAHMALAYLVVVLGGSAQEGRGTGLFLALLCFLTFNYFLLPPYHTFAVENPLDWLILLAFLVTGAVAAELLDRARREAELAREQASEIERLAAEAERTETLRQANRMKDALLATVSHDLRTPLTTIKALAAEIRAEGDARAAVVEEEADRLNRLVADLLDLSRLRGGGLSLQTELAAADDLIGAALQRLSGHPGAGRIQAVLKRDVLLVGRFDFVHALRALVNLLENALKYSPLHEAVDVTVRREAESLHVVVADRGPGVPPNETERIFEPFYRTVGSAPGGSGLGLAIARDLARAQGGDVTYSLRDGGGSTFVLQLPAADLSDGLFTES